MTAVILNFDGACEAVNPGGVSTFGVVVQAEPGDVVHAFGGVAAEGGPRSTNNFAEWVAMGKGLRWLADNAAALELGDGSALLVRGDSKLVIHQLTGEYACNAPHLVPLRDRCRELLAGLADLGVKWKAEWVDRDRNQAADAESQKAWVAFTGQPFPERKRARR